MDFKFSKDTGETPKQASGGEKGRQNVLLVVLLLLVGGFAYIYFFTGLIKPQEEQKPAEAPPPQVVKKPLPPREGEAAKAVTVAAPGTKGAPPAPAPAPAKPEPPKAGPAVPAAPVAPAAKEATKPAPPKPLEKKAQPAPPEKQPQKQVVAKAEEKKPAPAANKQPAAAQKKTPSAEKREATAKKPAPKPEKKPATAPGEAVGGRWTVVVGNYLLEDALAADMVRVRKAGLDAAVQQGAKKKAPMNRLLLAEYDERGTARAELDKLKRFTSDAFIIEHGGKFAVYAGSYLLDSRAMSEKERLSAAGFTLTLKRTDVAIPSKLLTAGAFSDRKSAEAVLKKLKAAGLKASLSHQ